MPQQQGASSGRPKSPDNKPTQSRYDHRGARDSGVRPKPALNTRTALVAVADPSPDPYKANAARDVATVNLRVDILEWERSHDRISEAAYLEGRRYQSLLERTSGGRVRSPSWDGAAGSNPWEAAELAAVQGALNAHELVGYLAHVRRQLGERSIDPDILRWVLGERLTYAEVATRVAQRGGRKAPGGRVGERAITYFAQRFRDALEALADCAAARGKGATDAHPRGGD